MIETDRTHQPIRVDDVDADWLLALCEDAEIQSREADRRRLRYALQWAHLHPADPDQAALGNVDPVGGDCTPDIEEFTAEPLAAAFGITAHAALQLISDALDLHHRLPRTWARVQALEVPAWRARRIAQATSQLTADQAAAVDAALAPRADKCGTRAIEKAIAEATDVEVQDQEEALDRSHWEVRLFHGPMAGPGRWAGTSILQITGDTHDLTDLYDQITTEAATIDTDDPLEVRQAMAVGIVSRKMNGGRSPRIKLIVHADLTDLTDHTIGTGSVERLGPLTIARIKDWVGHSQVNILPVLRMGRDDAVDRHDPPPWMREQVILRDRHCVHPHCQTDARSCDLDHIIPWPLGPTTPTNLAPLCRRHHRAKTRRRWHYRRDPDGTYTWTGPHDRRYRVTHDGTVPLD
ncbi:HNH endonuclease signature motif containing protein [Nocardioides sp. URHA0032]|uniref:HNH endonuclease signature motif containing protein n=1 Tax=Nocardioides sp. URHA0032 TaxID=1380388 RepID=UPI000490CD15|nr:HNH endonuclease signature motif containing protein [Nocardioides sp. URHA0032]